MYDKPIICTTYADCCDCGGYDCGCAYCHSCNQCEACEACEAYDWTGLETEAEELRICDHTKEFYTDDTQTL